MRHAARRRSGKVLVLLVITLPVVFGMLGLVFDGGLMLSQFRIDQQVCDAAATAGAMEKFQGASDSAARTKALGYVDTYNGLTNVTVECNLPPLSGTYAGVSGCCEVIVKQDLATNFMQLVGASPSQRIVTRGVAGYRDATQGAAVMVLDPSPDPLTIPPLSLSLPPLPTLLAGMEVLGVGKTKIEGAVIVNTNWGGRDENALVCALGPGPPYAIACDPLLPLMSLSAPDIRVVGGVDDPDHYRALTSGATAPLQTNRLLTPDPLATLPAPTISADSRNVRSNYYGGVTVVGLPIITPVTVLNPGVYDWIQVLSGRVLFKPGVYIIRDVHPVTRMSLSMVAGQATAEGVMFYITNNSTYSPGGAVLDDSDGSTTPASTVATLLPSAVVDVGLLTNSISGLDDPSSPFDGIAFYQRRQDRRPLVFVQQNLLGGNSLSGTIYAKWSHVILAGQGTYDLRVVCGTMRIIALLDLTIRPTKLLKPAQDVFVLE